MKNLRNHYLFTAIAIIFMFLTGCASTTVDLNRYFWPPLPDEPRIEWLGAYGSESDVKDKSWLSDFVGDEPFSFNRPLFPTSDGAGRIYVTDQEVGGLIRIDLAKKEMKFLGDAAAAAFFTSPSGVALDKNGNVYAADSKSGKVMVFDPNGLPSSVLDLSRYAKNIGGIAIDKIREHLIIPETRTHKILVFDLQGKLLNSIGKQGNGDGEFNYPTAVAVDKSGNIFVCDSMNARIQWFTPDLKFISKFGKRGDKIGEFNIIKSVAVDSEGHIYVTDGKSNHFGIYNEQGEVLLSVGGTFVARPGLSVSPGGFLLPQGIYIDQNDSIYIADFMNSRIQVFQYLNEKYLKEHPVSAQKTQK